ncbi:hypothetical protein HZA97_09820 [Candidatus Woesearchaeota archaeon]|nr:hypothetical protein [Candidatus Woesearchaeota archaeon]
MKKVINALLVSTVLTTSVYANELEFVPPIHEVARQVRQKEEREKYQEIFKSLPNNLDEKIKTPEQPEKDPVDQILRNLLIVIGIQADSFLSDVAVRELRKKLIKEADSRGNYLNEISLKIDRQQPQVIDPKKGTEIREIKGIEYNYISGVGISFRPSQNSAFETKLRGSVDPLDLEINPKIKTELKINNYLEIYGEIERKFKPNETGERKYEYGFTFNVLNFFNRNNKTPEQTYVPATAKSVLEEAKRNYDNKKKTKS